MNNALLAKAMSYSGNALRHLHTISASGALMCEIIKPFHFGDVRLTCMQRIYILTTRTFNYFICQSNTVEKVFGVMCRGRSTSVWAYIQLTDPSTRQTIRPVMADYL